MDISRTLLTEISDKIYYMKLWAEAVNTANYLRNRMCTSSAKDLDKTPYEIITGKKPNLSHLRKFVAKAYMHVPKQKRKNKFEERALEGLCVVYAHGTGYRVYVPLQGKILTSKDVTFEEKIQSSTQNDATESDNRKFLNESDPFHNRQHEQDNVSHDTDRHIGEFLFPEFGTEETDIEDHDEQSEESQPETYERIMPRRCSRISKKIQCHSHMMKP